MIKEPLTNLQKEILKLYSTDMAENDLNDLKTLLAKYYAKKAVKEADKIWNEKKLTNRDMDLWLNEE
ncbi:MAG: hypothetical protein HZA47_04600 [Planctomycetes bacterium]|uniref:hypothetical protein n=1 Tax=Candidatus Wunengus sp. YC65 TaxID=3367701 RepID=UPI001D1AFF3F|nr:hypothetical protein [Planctomycetota bacterium]MBI5795578.1 hypothetical protein [Planctomycetota bacterium]